MSAITPPAAAHQSAHAGKYLTFFLGREEYGLQILSVHEIIGMMPVTRVPQMPEFILGVVNLRGKVIPVVDLRKRFGFEVQQTQDVCIIVVQVRGLQMGIVVDRVSEVVTVKAEDIEPPPSFGVEVPTDFLLGIAKSQERVKLLLDIDHVLTTTDMNLAVATSVSSPDASAGA
jgi:purine-binding chemotaxis protein CheW